MQEHRLVQIIQLGSRLDPQLVAELLTGVPVGLQRVGLTPVSVQREHELTVQALAPRMLARDPLELGDQLGVAPGGQIRLHAQLQGGEALLLQSRDLGRGERRGGDLGERRSPPQLQRRAQRGGSIVATSGRERLAAVSDQTLEALGVELAGAHAQPVAGRGSYQHLRVAERLSQPRDVHLDGLDRAGRRLLAP